MKLEVELFDTRDIPGTITLDLSALGSIFSKNKSFDFDRNGKINAKDLNLAKQEIKSRAQAYFPGYTIELGPYTKPKLGARFYGRLDNRPTVLGTPGNVYLDTCWDAFQGLNPKPKQLAQWLAQVAVHEIGHQMGLNHVPETPMSSTIDLAWVYGWTKAQEDVISLYR